MPERTRLEGEEMIDMPARTGSVSAISRRGLLGATGAAAVLAPAGAFGAPPVAGSAVPFFRGMNFGYLSKQGYYGGRDALAQPAAMKKAGITWVSLMVMLMQDSFASTRVYRDTTYTPDDLELAGMIKACHDAGLKVLLKPVIDVWDSSWRGRIRFPEGDQQIQGIVTDYWTPWFDSMTRAIVYYARFAERTRCEGFTVAQELWGADDQTNRWLGAVAKVRAEYNGLLLVNVDGRSNPLDPPLRDWIRTLDAVGTSFYPTLGLGGTPSVEAITAVLRPERDRFARVAEATGRPVYFAECGVRSVTGVLAKQAGDYQHVGAYDGQLQANYIEAMLTTFWDEPWWAGFHLWKWDEQQDRPHYRQAGGDAGFTVAGKPAEAVLARWARRPDPRARRRTRP